MVAPASLAREMDADLQRTMRCWFPRCIDHQGGFHQNFDRRWQPGGEPVRALVYQARLTWVLATVSRRRPGLHACYRTWAQHGLDYLADHLRDHEHGGLRLRTDGPPEKHSYGMAFGVFAAAACARDKGIPGATELAMELFQWWDERAWDDEYHAYFDALNPDGSPKPAGDGDRDLISIPCGMRSTNTHLHAIEALTELYRATGNAAVGTRLEMLVRTLEELYATQGRLYPVYERDWRPRDQTVSFGHDIEAVYLVLDARGCLGWGADSPMLRLLSETIREGLDTRFGGMCFGRGRWRRQTQKVDWVQAEALNTLSYLVARDDEQQSAHLEALVSVWRFVATHVVDRELGGWFGVLDRRGRVVDDRKAHRWKACYHPVRALLNASDLLAPRSGDPATEQLQPRQKSIRARHALRLASTHTL